MMNERTADYAVCALFMLLAVFCLYSGFAHNNPFSWFIGSWMTVSACQEWRRTWRKDNEPK